MIEFFVIFFKRVLPGAGAAYGLFQPQECLFEAGDRRVDAAGGLFGFGEWLCHVVLPDRKAYC